MINKQNVLKYLIYLCVFFIPYTSFRIMGLKISEICMCLIFVLSLFIMKNKKHTINLKMPHVVFFIIFSGIIIASMCVNFLDNTYLEKIGLDNGIYYSYEFGWAFKIIRLFLAIYLTSFLIDFYKKNFENIRKIEYAYIISTLLIDIYAIVYMIINVSNVRFGVTRTKLMAGEASEAGFINAFSIIMLIYEIINNKNYRKTNIFILLIHLFTQIYIGSTASLIFLGISIFLTTIYMASKEKKYIKYVLIFSIILIIAVIFIANNTSIFNKITNYQYFLTVQGSSVVERITAIETGMEMFKQKPFLGFGWGNYGWFVEKYKTNDLFNTTGGGYFSANNQYVVILSELGICGGIAFVYFIYKTIKMVLKIKIQKDEKEKNNYLYVFVCIFTYVMLSNLTLNAIYSFQFWIAISVIIYFNMRKRIEDNNENINNK